MTSAPNGEGVVKKTTGKLSSSKKNYTPTTYTQKNTLQLVLQVLQFSENCREFWFRYHHLIQYATAGEAQAATSFFHLQK